MYALDGPLRRPGVGHFLAGSSWHNAASGTSLGQVTMTFEFEVELEFKVHSFTFTNSYLSVLFFGESSGGNTYSPGFWLTNDPPVLHWNDGGDSNNFDLGGATLVGQAHTLKLSQTSNGNSGCTRSVWLDGTKATDWVDASCYTAAIGLTREVFFNDPRSGTYSGYDGQIQARNVQLRMYQPLPPGPPPPAFPYACMSMQYSEYGAWPDECTRLRVLDMRTLSMRMYICIRRAAHSAQHRARSA